MGRMKEEFMAMREQEQENINQTNYKMKKVENNTTKKETVETVKETRKEALRRLFKDNGLVEEDVYKDKRGFVIITRTGIDKIVSKHNITVAYEVITMDIEKGICVLKAVASMKVNGDMRNMMSFGESKAEGDNSNLMGGGKKFPVAMAEKRAMSRVVLKIAGFYEQGVFGQDEIVDQVDDKFFNELINGEPLLCSCVQMGIIESLLRISPISEEEKSKSLLKKDVITIDPKDQWKKMFN